MILQNSRPPTFEFVVLKGIFFFKSDILSCKNVRHAEPPNVEATTGGQDMILKGVMKESKLLKCKLNFTESMLQIRNE